MIEKRSIKFPVRTDVDMSMHPERQRGGFIRPVIGGYIDIELQILSTEEAPLSVTHLANGVARPYRAWDGCLLSPVGDMDTWSIGRLDVEELPPGDYDVNARRPETSAAGHFYTFPYRSGFNYMNWTGGFITVLENPMLELEFAQAAEWTRQALKSVVLIDGVAWEKSDGPMIIPLAGRGNGENAGVLKAFPLGPEMHTATLDETRIFSIFDADLVADAFSAVYPGLRRSVGLVDVKSESRWDRTMLSRRVTFEAVVALAAKVDDDLKALVTNQASVDLLEASVNMREAWERLGVPPHDDATMREFLVAINGLVLEAKGLVPESRRRRWLATLDVADRVMGYEALVGFGLG